jgi:transketolase
MNFIYKTKDLFVKDLDLKNPPLKASRMGFAEALVELGKENPDIVVLGGDVTGSVKTDLFRDAFPDRFFSVGIAEQDMMGTAAGLAVAGKIPFASTYGEFATGRPFDQIRQSIAYSQMNVKICASHCGITVGPDGATHQSLEDVALMRVLPHMHVITPCDANQTYKAVKECVKVNGPFYIRFYRDNSPNFTNPDARFEFGKADTLVEGNDCTIIASGLLVWESLLAAEELKKDGIFVRVINMHTIKPIDADIVIKAAKETGCIVTAEDHQINAGLGGAVAEVLAKNYPAPMEFIGARDTFGESGSAPELMEKYGLSHSHIAGAVKKILDRKLK